jgi:multiple sugar transport system substrate-binding protein
MATGVLGAMPIEVFFINVMAGNSPDVNVTVKAPRTRDGQDITYAAGNAWAIATGAKNADAACAFLSHFAKAETWIAAAQARADARAEEDKPYSGTFTGHRTADEEIFTNIVSFPEGMEVFEEATRTAFELTDRGYSLPATGGAVDFQNAWGEAVNAVMNEGADPAAALQAADEEAQAALDAGGG